MKICSGCGQVVAEEVNTCPACGTEVAAGRSAIDDYRILEVLHEGYASILCKARGVGEASPVMIRIFSPPAGIDEALADRLRRELEELQELPDSYFVRHLAMRQSADGVWYRISEWVPALNWGSLLATGRLADSRTCLQLFAQIAAILEGLHRIGHIIPHLILDDILVYEDETGGLKVKIDYKLSRFLDPSLDRPGPMLARLLALHPDIIHGRPLDHRSDIWSLGKVFVEVLGADPDASDLQATAESLPLPAELRTLLRLMLSDDPVLRPQSMAEVAEALAGVSEDALKAAAERHDEAAGGTVRSLLRRVNLRLSVVAILLVLVIFGGGLLWYNLGVLRPGSEAALMAYANQYAGSVAFVVADYQLEQGNRIVYHNRSEGTAFLADAQGYLLTNRHVACPWLEDARLMMAIGLLRQQAEPLTFGYRLYVWFEGQRAFSRLPALSDSREVDDVYVTQNAFSTEGPRRVRIAGVAPAPAETRERLRAPLRDDFAILKIDPVPPGLTPLPLAEQFEAATLPKLTPLITLGFPLGSETQAETVNVSVTRGHVRRTFETLFQVDASLHAGNSGGPFIDASGRVVGLAAVVAVAWSRGPVPVATPLSDIGLVLPISRAADFLAEIKGGAFKWNGALDLALEKRLQRITAAALARDWDQARELADRELAAKPSPPLVTAAAMMHFCAGDHDGARRLFDQVLSIDPGNAMARLMHVVIAWREGQPAATVHGPTLTALDWRSPDEFMGYLARILLNRVPAGEVLNGGYTPTEKSWLHLLAGLLAERGGRLDAARELLAEAALWADSDDWSLYLALAQFDRVRQAQTAAAGDPARRRALQRQAEALDRRLAQALDAKAARNTRLAPLRAALTRSDADLETRRRQLVRFREEIPDNSEILVAQAYYAAIDEDWEAALDFAGRFLAQPGRTNADKLSVGLLEPELLNLQGKTELMRKRLAAFQGRIDDAWYRELSQSLLDRSLQPHVTAKSGDSPATLLTGHTALGLWAEGRGDAAGAVRHYREALGSYMDHRIEYDFAMGRLKRLRQRRP